MQSPGMTDWVLIANPNSSSIYYDLKIGGAPAPGGTGAIPAGGMTELTLPGTMGGLVEVSTWTDGTETLPQRAIASRRVLYNGCFSEVWSIPFD